MRIQSERDLEGRLVILNAMFRLDARSPSSASALCGNHVSKLKGNDDTAAAIYV